MKHRFGFLLLASGLLLMTAGALRGEMTIIFQKAVNICFECIGLG